MYATFRPLPSWPHEPTSPRREAQFKSPGRWVDVNGRREYRPGTRVNWTETLSLLGFEIEALGGDGVVIGLGLREVDIRIDGMPKANAPLPAHPGVEISFDSRYGRLTYATDVFDDWHDNVRAIAKGLEALRAVERWGVSRRGEQYAGFAQLTSGGPDAGRGKRLVDERFDGSIAAALRGTHPDTRRDGYTDRDFADVQAYRETAEARISAGAGS